MYEIGDIIALMRHASMATTYKPALLKAIARLVSRGHGSPLPLTTIGAEFVRLYWNQTVVYHLRQAAVISKESEVVHAIRATSDRLHTRNLGDVSGPAQAALARDMARVLRINVLELFHASKPTSMVALYSWRKGDDAIALSEEAIAFITANAGALEMIANYRWASYLERVNQLAPRVIEKVQRDGARRGSLRKYLDILRATDERRCFYCERPLDASTTTEIDHVVPWSFLLDDPLWDLVLACAACNGAKSDRLPAAAYLEKLIVTNAHRVTRRLIAPSLSLLVDGEHIRRLYDAALANEWPGPWQP